MYPNFVKGFMAYLAYAYFGLALIFKPFGRLIRAYVLPKPGQGPTEHELENGHLNVFGEGTGTDGKVVNCVLTFSKDPGYKETARMLVESGLCFIFNEKEMKNVSGGFWTSASCFGEVILNRLIATGSTFNFYNPNEKQKTD